MFGKRTNMVASFVAACILGVLAAPGSAGAAPPCVRVQHPVGVTTQTVKVTNHCRHRISFRVRIAGAPDSPCYLVGVGKSRKHKWPRWQTFQGIRWGCA